MEVIPSPSNQNQIQNQDLVEDQIFELEDLFPLIISSENAKWYSLAFHNVAAIVGAGVLGLPYAMSELGWGPGVVVLILSWAITLYALWQMIEMHEMIEGQGLDMYHDIGQAAFGKKLGLYIIVPLQLLGEISTCIAYMVTGGESLKTIHQLSMGDDKCTKIRIRHFILIFGSSQFGFSLLKNVNSFYGISLVAAVMSFSYSTIAWVASLTKGVTKNVEYGYIKRTTSVPVAFLSALGQIAFAQATIPSTTEISSKGSMRKGAIVAYIIVAFCYFPVALVGFRIFGISVEDNILQSLHDPKGLIIFANLFLVLHLIGNYQMYAMPVFGMIESMMIKKWNFRPTKVSMITIPKLQSFADKRLSCLVRKKKKKHYLVLYMAAVTMAIAVAFPYFNALLSVFGGFVSAPTTYFIPCIMWLILKKPKRLSLSWCINWICIILGVLVMIVAPIGGLAKLLDSIYRQSLPNSKCKIT